MNENIENLVDSLRLQANVLIKAIDTKDYDKCFELIGLMNRELIVLDIDIKNYIKELEDKINKKIMKNTKSRKLETIDKQGL